MFKVKSIVCTCEACPSQFEGLTEDNRQIYIRYRWGHLSVRIGEQDDLSENAGVRGEYILNEEAGEDMDGYMELEELKERTKGVLRWPEVIEEYVPVEYPPTESEIKLMKELFGKDFL